MSSRSRLVVIIADVLVLIELCISLYLASGDPEDYTAIFFKAFLVMVIPTLVAAKIVVRKLRARETKIEA